MAKHLGLILVKSNSKGLPGKNVINVGGQSLLGLGLNQMFSSNAFSDIYVSSDCPKILKEAVSYGAIAIKRDLELTSNDAYLAAVQHAVEAMPPEFDTITISQVVQPAKSRELFSKIIAAHGNEVDSVVTVSKFDSSPAWLYQGKANSRKLEKMPAINYGNTIARETNVFEIDNKVVSFTKRSFLAWDSFTPWPYLGNEIRFLEDWVVHPNLKIDINTQIDRSWMELLVGAGIWKP